MENFDSLEVGLTPEEKELFMETIFKGNLLIIDENELQQNIGIIFEFLISI
jgi:hypothetical protein